MTGKVLLLVLLCLLFPLAGPVFADQGIEASHSAEAEFPTRITFSLEAESASEITEVVLRYRVDKLEIIPITGMAVPEFEPAPGVETSWSWDTGRMGGLPPGTEIEYSWMIADAAGHELQTEPATVAFADLRYPWRHLSQDEIHLYWHRGDESFAAELLQAARQAKARLSAQTAVSLEGEVAIYIYADAAELRGALIQPSGWEGGVAFSEYAVIALGVSPQDLTWGKRTVAHELAHLILHRLTFNPYGDLPNWVDEGLAMYAEGGLEEQFRLALSQAISEDRLISLRSLSGSFPADPRQALLSYAESYSLVEFLLQHFGKERMALLLRTFALGTSYDDALLHAYGVDTDGLDSLWRTSLGLAARPALVIGHSLEFFYALIKAVLALLQPHFVPLLPVPAVNP